MRIADMIENSIKNYNENDIISTEEIIEKVHARYGTNKDSIIPSDYCYNRTNKGIDFEKSIHLFEYIKRGQYKYLGPNFRYNGTVIHKKQSTESENVVGHWNEGKFAWSEEL